MSRKRFRPEQIIGMLREADVRLTSGRQNYDLKSSAPRVYVCLSSVSGNCSSWNG
jgi:hypothetical protein